MRLSTARSFPIGKYKLIIKGFCHREIILKAKWLLKLPHERTQNRKLKQNSILRGLRANKMAIHAIAGKHTHICTLIHKHLNAYKRRIKKFGNVWDMCQLLFLNKVILCGWCFKFPLFRFVNIICAVVVVAVTFVVAIHILMPFQMSRYCCSCIHGVCIHMYMYVYVP